MRTYIDTVLEYLGPIEPDEMECVVRAIAELESLKWLPTEAYAKLRWLEHVNPTVSEELALRKMREINERVAQRLLANKTAVNS